MSRTETAAGARIQKKKGVRTASPKRIAKRKLQAMIDEATVDCYNDAEAASGFYTMIEENVGVPFETEILGVPVTVMSIDLTDGDQIVAICARGRQRQAVGLLELPLPSPQPDGSEWIEAYRHWIRGR